MKIKEIRKEIKGVFKQPVKKYYFGKIIHGTPYFAPSDFINTGIYIKKLKLKTKEEIDKYKERYPHLLCKPQSKFSNLPLVRRSKDWIIKIFQSYWFIQLGWPIVMGHNELGWKDKWNSPRFEWAPCFYIYLFNWQFIIWYTAPKLDNKHIDNDTYYEMILWFAKHCKKDIKVAEKTWGWVNSNTKESTWNKNYIL